MGKQVHYIDPYDQKISRYIEFNFEQNFSDQLSQQSIEWLQKNKYIKPIEAIK